MAGGQAAQRASHDPDGARAQMLREIRVMSRFEHLPLGERTEVQVQQDRQREADIDHLLGVLAEKRKDLSRLLRPGARQTGQHSPPDSPRGRSKDDRLRPNVRGR